MSVLHLPKIAGAGEGDKKRPAWEAAMLFLSCKSIGQSSGKGLCGHMVPELMQELEIHPGMCWLLGISLAEL